MKFDRTPQSARSWFAGRLVRAGNAASATSEMATRR